MPFRRRSATNTNRPPRVPPLLDRNTPITVCDPYLRNILIQNNPTLNIVPCDGKCCGGVPPLPYRLTDLGTVDLSQSSKTTTSQSTNLSKDVDSSDHSDSNSVSLDPPRPTPPRLKSMYEEEKKQLY